MNYKTVWCSVLFCFLLTPFAIAQNPNCLDPVQAPFGPGGTWNVYQACLTKMKWADALEQARAFEFDGVAGNLASIHSAAENQFIHGLTGAGEHAWIGLTDRVGVAPGAQEGTFAWTSGEPLTYEKWRKKQPSNSSGTEDGVYLFRNASDWNDDETGYALNQPVPDAGSLNESNGKSYVSVHEYNLGAASPYPGIEASYALLPNQPFGGPAATTGNWSVIDYYGSLTVEPPINDVVDLLVGIQNQVIDSQSATAQIPTLTLADPDNAGVMSPSLKLEFGEGLFPYPSNDLTAATADDANFLSVAHGRIQPQEDGIYTIQVQSSEGFALRIQDATVLNVAGGGTYDPFGPGTIYFAGDTENSSTKATYDLKAGQAYDVEFLTWERSGGAFVEVVSQKGDEINDPSINPQWMALGDPSVLPEVDRMPTARLTGPLRVVNMNRIEEFDQVIEAARDIIYDNLDGPDAESNDATRFQFDDSNVDPKGCPFGEFNHDGNAAQWPNSSGNRDDFISGVFGTLQVDDGDAVLNENITVSFYVSSDDRSSFRIVGEDFEEASNIELFDLDGDESIVADQNGCQNSYVGVISLKEGVDYDFEGIHVERGGDAGMQVLAAVGNHIEEFDPIQFTLLQTDAIKFSRNVGMQLLSQTDGPIGDYNQNGQLDAEDLDLQALAITGQDLSFDLNSDGTVDLADRQVWVNDLKNSWMGDANLDGEFNSNDLVVVFQVGAFESGNPATWSEGDWNGDGSFTSSDFVVAFQGGGYENGPRPENGVIAVPEPSTLLLLLISALFWLPTRASRSV